MSNEEHGTESAVDAAEAEELFGMDAGNDPVNAAWMNAVDRGDAKAAQRWTKILGKRVDPTRGARLARALQVVTEAKLDKRNKDRNYAYASKTSMYHTCRRALASCGLHVRSRLNREPETCQDLDLAGNWKSGKNTATIELNASFAVAAPLDGPKAALHWHQVVLYGPCRDVQSQRALYSYALKYFLEDVLLVSSQDGADADADMDTDIDTGGVSTISDRKRRGGGRGGWDEENRAVESARRGASIDALIKRGIAKLGLDEKGVEALRERHKNNRGEILSELIRRAKKAEQDAGNEKTGETEGPAAEKTAAPTAHSAEEEPETEPDGDGAHEAGEETNARETAAEPHAGETDGNARTPEDVEAEPAETAETADAEPEPKPKPERRPGILTVSDQAYVVRRTRSAGIVDGDAAEAVRTGLKVDRLADANADDIDAAAARLGLNLPRGTHPKDTAAAVIVHEVSSWTEGGEDGEPPPPADDDYDAGSELDPVPTGEPPPYDEPPPPSGPPPGPEPEPHGELHAGEPEDEPAAEPVDPNLDYRDETHRKMGDAALETLETLDPHAAADLRKRRFKNLELRLQTIDEAIARLRNRNRDRDAEKKRKKTAAAAAARRTETAGAEPAQTQRPKPRAAGAAKKPSAAKLTPAEIIKKKAKDAKLTKDQLAWIKKMAHGDEKEIISMIEEFKKSRAQDDE